MSCFWWTSVWTNRWAPILIGSSVVLVLGACGWPYTVDDTFIVLRYGEAIASGQGYTLVHGPPTDGVTGPLWLLPPLCAHWLGLSSESVTKVSGLLSMAVSVGLVLHRLRGSAIGRSAAWCGALLLGSQSSLAIWGVAGLETGAASLACTVGALGATRRSGVCTWSTALSCTALPWLRPECIVLSAALVVVAALRNKRQGVSIGLAAGLGVASVVAFRLWMFGDPLPLPFYAKPGELSEGLRYLGRGLLLTTGLIGIVPVTLAMRGTPAGVLGLVVLAHFAAVAFAGGDWMPGARLLAPVLPVLLGLAASGIGRLAVRRKWAAVVLFVGVLAIPSMDIVAQMPVVRDAGEARRVTGSQLADWMKNHGRRVALVDVGYLGWRSGLDIVDLGGVTDPAVAHWPGGHLDKHIPSGWIATRSPDLIVLHSSRPPVVGADGSLEALAGYPVERRVASDPWVRSHFRVARTLRYGAGYWYAVLWRR